MLFDCGGVQRLGRKAGEALRESRAGAGLHTILLPREPNGGQDSITIRLADNEGQRNRANMLLKRMYSWRGYGGDELPKAPNCITFTATSQDDVIGTLSLTIDSPAGLAADRTFGDEIEKFRAAPGAKLCELSKLAFDTGSPARPRLAALFHIIFIYGSMHYGCTDLFIEVHPRHRLFYEVMLGFKPVGKPRTNRGAGIETQLLWINVGDIRRYIDEQAGRQRRASRSLYGHFFSRKEEIGIYGRLTGLADPETSFAANAHAHGRSSVGQIAEPNRELPRL